MSIIAITIIFIIILIMTISTIILIYNILKKTKKERKKTDITYKNIYNLNCKLWVNQALNMTLSLNLFFAFI